VQTFLPYPSFSESANVLDYRRLGKQRVEAWQILNILNGNSKSNAWRNHPAVRMWRGYEMSLAHYGVAMCTEWKNRGFNDTMLRRFEDVLPSKLLIYGALMPLWWGDEQFHRSHRSNLLRKNKSYYGQLWPNENDTLPYIWPV